MNLRSATDLTNEDRRKDALSELDRGAEPAAWVGRWREGLRDLLADPTCAVDDYDTDRISNLRSELEGSEPDCAAAEKERDEIKFAAERLISALDDMPEHPAAVEKAIAELENVL